MRATAAAASQDHNFAVQHRSAAAAARDRSAAAPRRRLVDSSDDDDDSDNDGNRDDDERRRREREIATAPLMPLFIRAAPLLPGALETLYPAVEAQPFSGFRSCSGDDEETAGAKARAAAADSFTPWVLRCAGD